MLAGQAAARLALGQLLPGKVVERQNRFVVEVELSGRVVKAHLADPGRLEELVFPGNVVMVRRGTGERATAYDLVLARFVSSQSKNSGSVWVCVDTRLPNRLFQEALRRGALHEFRGVKSLRQEVYLSENGPSRFDFLVETESGPVVVEVKSVSLCRDGVGLFPDAPTKRGTRHTHELAELSRKGTAACLVFIAQRADVIRVRPNSELDPEFAAAVHCALLAGVGLYAYRCRVSPNAIELLSEPIPVEV
ncbi:MAG: DNA/RNA nuclease SfsA [Bacillota bacterium]